MVVWVVLLACGAVIFFCARYIYRQIWPNKYWNGPAPTPQQEKEASHRMTVLLIKFPDLDIIAKSFAKEAMAAQAVIEYEMLSKLLADGAISQGEYDARVEQIAEKIDISDITSC